MDLCDTSSSVLTVSPPGVLAVRRPLVVFLRSDPGPRCEDLRTVDHQGEEASDLGGQPYEPALGYREPDRCPSCGADGEPGKRPLDVLGGDVALSRAVRDSVSEICWRGGNSRHATSRVFPLCCGS